MKYRILKIIDETEGRIDEKGKNTRFALKIGTLPGTRRNNNGYIDCAALDKKRSAMGRACTHTRLLTQKKPGFPGYFYLSVSGGGKSGSLSASLPTMAFVPSITISVIVSRWRCACRWSSSCKLSGNSTMVHFLFLRSVMRFPPYFGEVFLYCVHFAPRT